MDAPLYEYSMLRQGHKKTKVPTIEGKSQFIMPGKTKSIPQTETQKVANQFRKNPQHTHTKHTQSAYFEWHLRPNDRSCSHCRLFSPPRTFQVPLPHTHTDVGQTLAHRRLGASAVIVVFQFEWFNIKRSEDGKTHTRETLHSPWSLRAGALLWQAL